MAKVLTTEIRAGNLIEWEKRVWRVLKSHHVHVGGRGGAFMQVEMKDIESGTKRNERMRTEDKIERAHVDQRAMQFLYNDGSGYVFMDQETFEQLTLPADFLEGQAGYLIPNTDVQINFHNDRPIGKPRSRRSDRIGGFVQSKIVEHLDPTPSTARLLIPTATAPMLPPGKARALSERHSELTPL